MDELFQTIRDAADSGTWSRGVELSRASAVTLEREDDECITLRVTTGGGAESFVVQLYPEDEEWSCECSSIEEACEHVTGAAIALRSAARAGKKLPSPTSTYGHVAYHFKRTGLGLSFRRSLVLPNGEETPLEVSLAIVVKRGKFAGQLSVASQDYDVERLTGTLPIAVVSRSQFKRLVESLDESAKVFIDRTPVALAKPRATMKAIITKRGTGIHVQLKDLKGTHEHFANGIVLHDNTLFVATEFTSTSSELASFRGVGRTIESSELPDFMSTTLPALERQVVVERRELTLPTLTRVKPTIQWTTRENPRGLEVMPLLVYGTPPQARVDGDKLVQLSPNALPVRDKNAETQLIRYLRREFDLAPGIKEVWPPGAAFKLAPKLDGARIDGDAHRNYVLRGTLKPAIHAPTEADIIGLQFRLVDQDSSVNVVTSNDVMRKWNLGERFIKLETGGFAELPVEWLQRHGDRLAEVIAALNMSKGNKPAYLAPLVENLFKDLGEAQPPIVQDWLESIESPRPLPQATPESLWDILRPYQKLGSEWLSQRLSMGMGALLADDMGLGKTLQTMSVIQDNTLIVAPTSVAFNWVRELEKFRPDLRVNHYRGHKRQLDDSDVTVTSYALLRIDQELLCSKDWGLAVLDESQAIKNPGSQVTQAAFQLKANYRVSLTGTPIENHLSDLWSQMHFLNPGLLGGMRSFERRYTKPVTGGDKVALKRLHQTTGPFILRRTKQEVAQDLPQRTEYNLYCQLSEGELELYETLRASTQDELLREVDPNLDAMSVLAALLRLRQASCHPALIPGHDAASSSKLELLFDHLERATDNGHKCLVFSQWTQFLDLVEARLNESPWTAWTRLDGSTKDRGAVVDTFQNDRDVQIMLLSLQAGGTGLNLTAADHVYLLDPWWNPAAEAQAADRAHRIGQTKPVFIHRLVAKDTVEEAILDLQAAKRDLAESALGDRSTATRITRDDILALIAAA